MQFPSLDDYVELTQDRPELDLHHGAVGVIRGAAVFPWPVYEVEFLPEGGQWPVHVLVPLEQIRPAPHSPFDPDPVTGHEMYF